MKRSTGKASKADVSRFSALKAHGCLCCWLNKHKPIGVAEIHHLLSGHRGLGHQYTLPLCRWHHRGEPKEGWTATDMEVTYGPSLARSSKAFHERYGSDEQLLAEINRRMS